MSMTDAAPVSTAPASRIRRMPGDDIIVQESRLVSVWSQTSAILDRFTVLGILTGSLKDSKIWKTSGFVDGIH